MSDRAIVIPTTAPSQPPSLAAYSPDIKATSLNSASDMVMLIIFGQSNPEGVPSIGTPWAGPAPDVKIMGYQSWTFEPYNTDDKNVHRDARKTSSDLGTEAARLWQERIDGGEDLPPLCIINCSRSGAGHSLNETIISVSSNRWNTNLEKSDGSGFWVEATEGVDDQADVSLRSLLFQTVQAGISQIAGWGKRPVLLAALQGGFEADVTSEAAAQEYGNALESYRAMIAGLSGCISPPFFVTKVRAVSESVYPQANIDIANAHVDTFAATRAGVKVIDPAQLGIDPIFVDGVHFTKVTQGAVMADLFARTIDAGAYGVVARKVSA